MQRTQKGGKHTHRLRPIARWLQRSMMWKSGLGEEFCLETTKKSKNIWETMCQFYQNYIISKNFPTPKQNSQTYLI